MEVRVGTGDNVAVQVAVKNGLDPPEAVKVKITSGLFVGVFVSVAVGEPIKVAVGDNV